MLGLAPEVFVRAISAVRLLVRSDSASRAGAPAPESVATLDAAPNRYYRLRPRAAHEHSRH